MIGFFYTSQIASTTETLLRTVGIFGGVKGYWYITCGVDLILEDPSRMFLVTKRLYRDIAQIFETTPQAVERGIRTAIRGGWEHGDRTAFELLMGCRLKECPSNLEFLDSIVHKIRSEG